MTACCYSQPSGYIQQLNTGAAAHLSGMHAFCVFAMLRLRYRKHLMLHSWVRQAPHTEKWASERIHTKSWYVAALQGLRTSNLSPSTEGWTSTSALQHSCLGQGSPPLSPTLTNWKWHYTICLRLFHSSISLLLLSLHQRLIWQKLNRVGWRLSESQRQPWTNCQHLESNRRGGGEDVNNGGMEIPDNAGINQMLWHHCLILLFACVLLLILFAICAQT